MIHDCFSNPHANAPHCFSNPHSDTPHLFCRVNKKKVIDDHDRERGERVEAMCCCSEAELWVEVSAKGVFFAKLALCPNKVTCTSLTVASRRFAFVSATRGGVKNSIDRLLEVSLHGHVACCNRVDVLV